MPENNEIKKSDNVTQEPNAVTQESNDVVQGSNIEHVEEKPAAEHSTAYPDFVEGVYTREIARMEGVDEKCVARTFKQAGENEDIIHIAGEKDVVSDIGDTLENRGFRVREWRIKRPEDPSTEADRIQTAIDKFATQSPPKVIDNVIEGVRRRLGLPSTRVDKVAGKLASREDEEIKEATTELKETIDKGIKEAGGK